jgi:hypothetical protein
MEQQECITSPITTNEIAIDKVGGLPKDTAADPSISSRRWPLGLEVRLVDFLSSYTVHGILEGFTPGEVSILLNEAVSEQRIVSLHLNSFTFEGHTLYCRPRQDQFEVHISIDDAETTGLRRAPRFPVEVPAALLLAHGAVAMTIVDISSDGLGLKLPVPLEPDQPIAVATESVFVFAIVRHCRQLSEGVFRAGAEMHHLLERHVELPKDSPRSNFLQKLLGSRYRKGAGFSANGTLLNGLS